MKVTKEEFIGVTYDELLDENAKLRAEAEALKRDEWAAGFSAGCDAVEAAYEDGRPYYEVENDKLRELVKSMYYDLTNMTFPPDWVTDYEADMRELGIEVTT